MRLTDRLFCLQWERLPRGCFSRPNSLQVCRFTSWGRARDVRKRPEFWRLGRARALDLVPTLVGPVRSLRLTAPYIADKCVDYSNSECGDLDDATSDNIGTRGKS